MDEALKEVWKSKFKKAKEKEFNVQATNLEQEIELLKFKIDEYLDKRDMKMVKNLSEKLKSIESFLALKAS